MKKNKQAVTPPVAKKDHSYIILIIILIFGFIIRCLSFGIVFNGIYVSFLETDAYDLMYLARHISGLPLGQAIHYTLNNSLLWSGIIATGGKIFPIELVGAWLPPICAVITIFLCYLLGKELFNKIVGLMTAAFVAIMPSEFLHRSLLGYADHHVLEVLLMVLTIYLVIKAIKAETRVWLWSIAAGFTLYAYLANWTAGMLLFGVIVLFGIIYLTYSLKRKEGWRKPLFIFGLVLGIAIICYLPMGGWARIQGYLPFINHTTLPVAGQTSQEILNTMLTPLNKVTTSEMMPLLFPFGSFDLGVVSTNLNIFAILFIVGLILLWRFRDDGKVMMIAAWSIVLLIITLMQRRFLYYFEIPAALLSALVIYTIAKLVNVRQGIAAAIITIPLVLINIPSANTVAQVTAFSMSKEWYSDLQWLKTQPITGSITAWSDYGSWILYETGHQPNLMPGGGGSEVAQLLLSEDDTQAVKQMKELGTEYLIVDTTLYATKFQALEITAGQTIATDQKENTLIYHLLYSIGMPADIHLSLVRSSQTIRIFKFNKGSS